MERKRWTGALAAIAALTLLLAACGGDEGPSTTPTGKQTPHVTTPVTLTFWQTMNPEETPNLKSIVDKFTAAHPNYTINMETVPFDQAQAKYTTAAQAGKAPDVLRAEIAWIADYAAQGFLADLTNYVSDADKADYLPTAFNYGVYLDKIWAIPQVTDAPALLYNKKMLADAAVEVPKTLDEMAAACEKIGSRKGVFLVRDAYFIQPWIWGYGGGLIDPAAKSILIANSGSVAGLEAYLKLFKSGCAFRNRDFANEYNNRQTAFKNGQVAMIVNGPWSTADILSGSAFKDPTNLGIAAVPAGPAGQGSPVGGHSYVVAANSTNKDAAYEFISWINQAEHQGLLAEKNNLLPTRKSAYQLPAVTGNRLVADFLAQMQVATNRPVLPQGGQIYTDFTPNMEKAVLGRLSAKAALTAVANAWKTKLLPDYSIAS